MSLLSHLHTAVLTQTIIIGIAITMTIIHRFSCNPLSSLPLHRSEAPAAKRRKLNKRLVEDNVGDQNSIRPMIIDGNDATTSLACSDEGNTLTMMEVEQSSEDFVERLLKV